MALPAQRHEAPNTAASRSDDSAADTLDERSVLAALEHEYLEGAGEDAPRGIVIGATVGLAFWLLLLGAYFLYATF